MIGSLTSGSPTPAFCAPRCAGAPQYVSSQISHTPFTISSTKRPLPSRHSARIRCCSMARRAKAIGLEPAAITVAFEVEKCRRQQRLPARLLVGLCPRHDRRANVTRNRLPCRALAPRGIRMPRAGRHQVALEKRFRVGCAQQIVWRDQKRSRALLLRRPARDWSENARSPAENAKTSAAPQAQGYRP